MLSHVIPQCLVTDRIPIKLQLTGKSRLTFKLLMMTPTMEFVKGIPESLENDYYLDVNIRNLIVIDDQMIEAGKDNRIMNLFTKRIASPKSER